MQPGPTDQSGETSDRTPEKATPTPLDQKDSDAGKTSDRSQDKNVKVEHQPGAAGTAGSNASEGASFGTSGSDTTSPAAVRPHPLRPANSNLRKTVWTGVCFDVRLDSPKTAAEATDDRKNVGIHRDASRPLHGIAAAPALKRLSHWPASLAKAGCAATWSLPVVTSTCAGSADVRHRRLFPPIAGYRLAISYVLRSAWERHRRAWS